MALSHDVMQDVSSTVKLLPAAVAAALVDLSSDEVNQLDLLVELEV